MNKLTKIELRQLCQLARNAAIEAGIYIQSKFNSHYSRSQKQGGDTIASQVLTEVDLKAQQIILSQLQNSIDDYNLGLLTEEIADDQSRGAKDYFWCIDPLDGTLPFTERRTGYAVSIALVSKAGDPEIGVVYIPDLKQCYTSVRGDGVLYNEKLFRRESKESDQELHFYMDRSFQYEPYYDEVKQELVQWIRRNQLSEVVYHANFGGVRNAIGVMNSGIGCYFKFPKRSKGGGSIWDYASTRLFFEELGLSISNAKNERLYLNDLQTTFLNDQGVVYSTNEGLSKFIVQIGNKVKGLNKG